MVVLHFFCYLNMYRCVGDLCLSIIVNKIQTNAVLISSYFLIFVENLLKLQVMMKKKSLIGRGGLFSPADIS